MSRQQTQTPSPLGRITLTEENDALIALSWHATEPQADRSPRSPLLEEACAQLATYFDGTRRQFDLPLRVNGSAFQQAVCAAMSDIPYGETRSYGEIAKALGRPPQPVGQACGANPLPILIPCHRVLGAKGLGGFSGAGGVESKVALLRLEGAAGLLI